MSTLQEYRHEKAQKKEESRATQNNKKFLTCREYAGKLGGEIVVGTITPVNHKDFTPASIQSGLAEGVVLRVNIRSVDANGDWYNNESIRLLVVSDGTTIEVSHYVGADNNKPNWAVEVGKKLSRKWAVHMLKDRMAFDILKRSKMREAIQKLVGSTKDTMKVEDVVSSLDELDND